ncbi:KRAB domain-containing zinc finger protein [Sarotherodon galilaeus]
MSHTSKETQGAAAALEEETELEQTDESNIGQNIAPPEEPRRSERARTLTEKGKESVLKRDPSDILQEHIISIQRELSELNIAYDDYRRIDQPAHDMRRKMDNCISITKTVVQNAQSEMQGTAEELIWPDHSSVFSSSASSVSLPASNGSKASSIHSNVSSLRRQEAAAEYAATQAVLQIMAEQEGHQEKLQNLDAEERLIIADQEAVALARRLEGEREETERRLEREKQEAALLKKQQEDNAARRRSVENLKRELERLENLKRLNAAKARLQVYDENELSPAQGNAPQSLDLHKIMQPLNQVKPADQHSQPPKDAVPTHVHQDSTGELVKVLAEAISANRLPIPEPTVFSGDSLKFNHWKSSFQTLIERKNIPEKIFFLQKYVGGAAREALEGYFLIGSDTAYVAAWELLNERYGQPFMIAKACRDKLHAWPKIASRESADLRKFVDFLRSCECAMAHNESLRILDDGIENQKLTAKLPDWLSSRWNRKATQYQLEHGRFPDFKYFVTFLTLEASIACNPVTSYYALRQGEPENTRSKPQNVVTSENQGASARIFTTNTTEKNISTCMFCKKTGHVLHKCHRLTARPVADRVKFIQGEKLCFGCLSPGHQSKNCSNRMVCDTCSKRHPTCLHEDRSKQQENDETSCSKERKPQSPQDTTQETTQETTSNRVVHDGNSAQTSAIVPVYASMPSDSNREVLVYALLDSHSDSSFILEEVADALDVNAEPVKLKLSTMSSKETIVPCKRLKGLQVRGLSSSKKITVPTVYTREFIRADRAHIPTPETARAWPHLEHLAEHIAPLKKCEIGLLIGYNCPQALMPREVVSGEDNQPFAQETDVGWSIVSYGDPGERYSDAIGVSHRIIVKQVTPEPKVTSKLKSKVHYVLKTRIKEMTTPEDVLKVLESDFSERLGEEANLSQEDLRFLTKMKEEIKHKGDGHLEMPLPFKQSRPELPNNKLCAVLRLMCLEKKLKRDQKYRTDYMNFMKDIISHGEAEKVPEEELDKQSTWYIPHHGKLRVVFDCSARFQDTSLNDHLLTGPELTNTLVGVLCRFRKGPVAIMCDVERMFHQFHVKPEDQDYLRFLWWENGNLESPPSVFRMKVHLFGAASSPGCANFGLKHLATEGQDRFNQSTVKFIRRNFYVDDGLVSVRSDVEAIELIKEARELCSAGKLRLHKFISNRKKVLESIPKEECADSVKELDIDLGEPLLERALGVQWCVSSDDFQFRVTVKKHPMTRRGVLSTVASIFDPLERKKKEKERRKRKKRRKKGRRK